MITGIGNSPHGNYGMQNMSVKRKEMFKKADQDGDGKVTKEELSAVLPKNGKGPGVDAILDLHLLDLPDYSVGTALCLDTLEHVERPYAALAEMYRVLRPDGACIISSVLAFPIHEYPQDFWRFTPAAFKLVLRPFPSMMVGYIGEDRFPHTVLGVGIKGPADFAAFAGACWQRLAMRVA